MWTAIWIGIACPVIIGIGILLYGLCDQSYRADEAMGAQEWQVPEEERLKGYPK